MLQAPTPAAPTPGGTVDGAGTAAKTGGSGPGSNDGVPNGRGTGEGGEVSALPKLLNRDEVMANLRRFYPESERRAGREGKVVTAIHIGADGRVGEVDILQSAGTAFDAAAKQVAALMRFSPAVAKGGAPAAVKIKQSMTFRLKDE